MPRLLHHISARYLVAPSIYKILLAIGAFPAVWGTMISPERHPVGKKCQI